ncbi:hypothetical protein F2P81_023692 [Scophthalmus maximus]|uniref:Uncharacterized protein n=1 Tax=Scophthalmus maximus TaxID=52904 RepID=A0A6A4RVG3_SCOMX|nr:hypothetical protein F2P81_023692 [Scophthalmus maximus]
MSTAAILTWPKCVSIINESSELNTCSPCEIIQRHVHYAPARSFECRMTVTTGNKTMPPILCKPHNIFNV